MRSYLSLPLIALLLPAANSRADDLPIRAFVKRPEYVQVKLSPTGEYLAITAPTADRTMLAIVRRSDSKRLALDGGGRNEHVSEFYWVNDDRVVFKLATQKGWLDYPVNHGELFAVSADGSNRKAIFGYRSGEMQTGTRIKKAQAKRAWGWVIDPLPDNRNEIIIGATPWAANGKKSLTHIYRLNVYTRMTKRLGTVPMPNATVLTDNNGQPRIAVSARNRDRDEVWTRAAEGGDWKRAPVPANHRLIPLRFAPDGLSFYGFGHIDGGTSGLYRYGLRNWAAQELFRHEAVDIWQPVRDLAGNGLAGVRYQPGLTKFYFIDDASRTAKFYRMLERAFRGQEVWITSTTRDGKEAMVFVQSDTSPGDYYILNTVTKQADHFNTLQPWLDPEQMAPSKPITVKARDGLSLHGYVTLPRVGGGKNLPMVVLPHGGPFRTRDRWAFNPEVQLLASRGYAVLRVNFRGSGGYGLEFGDAWHGEYGGKMQNDLTDATTWAIEQGIADAKRICIYGTSYGAYAALVGAVREPQLYRCAAGVAGLYDLEIKMKQESRKDLSYLLGSAPEAERTRSPVYAAAKLRVPIFIAHGGRDENTPIAHAKRLQETTEEAGKDAEYLYFPDEGHGFYDEENNVKLYTRLLAFFARHIGGK